MIIHIVVIGITPLVPIELVFRVMLQDIYCIRILKLKTRLYELYLVYVFAFRSLYFLYIQTYF